MPQPVPAPFALAQTGGFVTSATSTTLTDSNQNWTSSLYVGSWVVILQGTGSIQAPLLITANTATQLTVTGWAVQPDTTSQYCIFPFQPVLGGPALPLKLANISAQLLLVNYATASVTLAAAATSNIQNYTGAGTVIILYSGDGDGSFNMQVVVDGVLDDTLPTNQQGIYIGTYASTLVVRVQNPTAGSLTKKTSTFRLSGINFS